MDPVVIGDGKFGRTYPVAKFEVVPGIDGPKCSAGILGGNTEGLYNSIAAHNVYGEIGIIFGRQYTEYICAMAYQIACRTGRGGYLS